LLRRAAVLNTSIEINQLTVDMTTAYFDTTAGIQSFRVIINPKVGSNIYNPGGVTVF
jgi:hypothetical protein